MCGCALPLTVTPRSLPLSASTGLPAAALRQLPRSSTLVRAKGRAGADSPAGSTRARLRVGQGEAPERRLYEQQQLDIDAGPDRIRAAASLLRHRNTRLGTWRPCTQP